MTHYRDNNGRYLGQWTNGASPPSGALECDAPPSADAVWGGSNWLPPDPRLTTAIRKEDFCKKLFVLGVLPEDQAVEAAQNRWPATFDAFAATLTPEARVDAKATWAQRAKIHYMHPLLQELALTWANAQPDVVSGSVTAEAKRTEILDQIYGIGS